MSKRIERVPLKYNRKQLCFQGKKEGESLIYVSNDFCSQKTQQQTHFSFFLGLRNLWFYCVQSTQKLLKDLFFFLVFPLLGSTKQFVLNSLLKGKSAKTDTTVNNARPTLHKVLTLVLVGLLLLGLHYTLKNTDLERCQLQLLIHYA